jgi:hypothetical protein
MLTRYLKLFAGRELPLMNLSGVHFFLPQHLMILFLPAERTQIKLFDFETLVLYSHLAAVWTQLAYSCRLSFSSHPAMKIGQKFDFQFKLEVFFTSERSSKTTQTARKSRNLAHFRIFSLPVPLCD